MLALTVTIALAGCASSPSRERARSPESLGPPPSYAEVAERYNSRAARLSRIWSRAVVRIEYTDDEGKRRREQGEGHLQLVQPSQFALDVRKLGELLMWLGCDDQRYWLLELHEAKRAQVGLHANLGKPCSAEAGLPAHPLDIVEMLGVTPIPTTWPGVSAGSPIGETKWSSDGSSVVVDMPGFAGYRRLFLDPQSFVPRRIEIYSHPDRELALSAELTLYEPVEIRAGGGRPQMASRIIIEGA
ncbi:MAG: hypothetical protein VYC34_07635, partial [Planctomycetota bacterium]|nr:hypothetical protein [Planctomycetota bacterium]